MESLEQMQSIGDLLQEQMDVLIGALPEDVSFYDWYSDGCALAELRIRDDAHRNEVAFAFGYLRGAHEMRNLTMLEMFDEYGVDALYICANCEQSTRPGTPSPHVCKAKPKTKKLLSKRTK